MGCAVFERLSGGRTSPLASSPASSCCRGSRERARCRSEGGMQADLPPCRLLYPRLRVQNTATTARLIWLVAPFIRWRKKSSARSPSPCLYCARFFCTRALAESLEALSSLRCRKSAQRWLPLSRANSSSVWPVWLRAPTTCPPLIIYGPLNYRRAARTLFHRPYLAHFCPVFSRFFAVFSVLTPGFQKVAPKDRGPVP